METSARTLLVGATLFTCTICDKPFTKEPQYKRHVSYCRKAQGGRTRTRSCRACHSAKIKCDSRAPCHQCVRKKVSCVYDQPAYQQREGKCMSKSLGDDVVSVGSVTAPLSDAVVRIDEQSTPAEVEMENVELGLIDDHLFEQFDVDEEFCFDPLPEYPRLLNKDGLAGIRETGQGNSMSTTTMTPPAKNVDSFMSLLHQTMNKTMDTNLANHTDFQMFDHGYSHGKELQLPIFSPEYWESTTTAMPYPPSLSPAISSSNMDFPRHFSRTEVQTSLQKAHATLIIDMIRPYPRMMMRRETFPPFVHAYVPSEDGQDRLPSALTNCMGIAQLFAVCNDDTRPFLWDTIRTEMKGFRDRFSTFEKCEAFAALQACLIYLIMRAVDGAPQEVADDWDMIVIYDLVCRHACSFATDHNQVFQDPNILWKDWILAESCRRIACVWFILTRVFQVRTGMPCYVSDNFRWIPLPCTKAEWEAKTEASWRASYHAANSLKSGVQTFGDLIDAYQNRESSKLDTWNASIDHLGMTLNLTVHII